MASNFMTDFLAGAVDNYAQQGADNYAQQNPTPAPSVPPVTPPGQSQPSAPTQDTTSTQANPQYQQPPTNAAGVRLAAPVSPGNPSAMTAAPYPAPLPNPARSFLGSFRGMLQGAMGSPDYYRNQNKAREIDIQNTQAQQAWQQQEQARAQGQRTFDVQKLGQQLISGEDAQGNPADRGGTALTFAQTYPNEFGEFVQKNGSAFAGQAEGYQTVATELQKASGLVARGWDPNTALDQAKRAIVAQHPEMAGAEKDLTPQNFMQMAGIAQQISAAGFASRQGTNQAMAKAGAPNPAAPQNVFNPTGEQVDFADPQTGQTVKAMKLQDPNNPNRTRYDISPYMNGQQNGLDRNEINRQQEDYNTARTKFAQTTARTRNVMSMLSGPLDGPRATAALNGFAALVAGKDTVGADEGAQVLGGLPLTQALGPLYNKLSTGSSLTASQVAGMKGIVKQYYGSQVDAFRPIVDQKLAYAGRYGVDPHQVVSDYDAMKTFSPDPTSKKTEDFTSAYSDAAASRKERLQTLAPDGLYDPDQGRYDIKPHSTVAGDPGAPPPAPEPTPAAQPPAGKDRFAGTPQPGPGAVEQRPSPPPGGPSATPGGPPTPRSPGGAATPAAPQPPATPEPPAPTKAATFAFGDSLADGFRGGTGIPGQHGNYRLGGATNGGDNTSAVLANIHKYPMTDAATGRPSLEGQRVVLSSGWTNEAKPGSKELDNVRQQVHELQARGANVVLLGVGPGGKQRPGLANGNNSLQQVATEAGRYGAPVEFADWNKDGLQANGGIHPDSNQLLSYVNRGAATQRQQTPAAADPLANTGLTENYRRATLGIESRGGQNIASSPGHAASGFYQFEPDTWRQYAARVPGASAYAEAYQAPREVQDKVFEAFTQDNVAQLKAKNIPVNDATVYMAHQQGPGGAAKLMTAAPGAVAAQVVGARNARGNWPFFYDRNPAEPGARPLTVQESRQAFERHIGTQSRTPATQSTPSTPGDDGNTALAASPSRTTPRQAPSQTPRQPAISAPQTPTANPGAPPPAGSAPIQPGTPPVQPGHTASPEDAEAQAAGNASAARSPMSEQIASYAQLYGLPPGAVQAAMNAPAARLQSGASEALAGANPLQPTGATENGQWQEYAQRVAMTYGLGRTQLGQLMKFMTEHPNAQAEAVQSANADIGGAIDAAAQGALHGATTGLYPENEQLAAAHPVADFVGDTAGAIAPIGAAARGVAAVGDAVGATRGAISFVGRQAARPAVAGITAGTIYGAARGGVEAPRNGEDAAAGAATGAVTGAVGGAVGAVVGAAVGKAAEAIGQVLGLPKKAGVAALNHVASEMGVPPDQVARSIIDGSDPKVAQALQDLGVNPAAARRAALSQETEIPASKNQVTGLGDQVAGRNLREQQEASTAAAAQRFQNDQLPPGQSGQPAAPPSVGKPQADISPQVANEATIQDAKANRGRNLADMPELDPDAKVAFDRAKQRYAQADALIGSAQGRNTISGTTMAGRVRTAMRLRDGIEPSQGQPADAFLNRLADAGHTLDQSKGAAGQSVFKTLDDIRSKASAQATALAQANNRGADYQGLRSLARAVDGEWNRQAQRLGPAGASAIVRRRAAGALYEQAMGTAAKSQDVVDNLAALAHADPAGRNNAAKLLFNGMAKDSDTAGKIGNTLMDPSVLPPAGQTAARLLFLKQALANPDGSWRTGEELRQAITGKLGTGGKLEGGTRAFFGNSGVQRLDEMGEALKTIAGKSGPRTHLEGRIETVEDIGIADVAGLSADATATRLSGAIGKASTGNYLLGVSIGALRGAVALAAKLGPTARPYTLPQLLAEARRRAGQSLASQGAQSGSLLGAASAPQVKRGLDAQVPAAGEAQ